MRNGFNKRAYSSIVYIILMAFLAETAWASSAAGISPSYVEINFFPNAEYTYTFRQEGYSSMDFEYICPYLSVNNETLTDENGINSFSVTIKLPDKIDAEPGNYDCGFLLTRPKNPNMPPGIAAQAMVGARIIIKIPVKGKYASMTLEANNANKGEPVYFKAGVKNLGDAALRGLSAVIDVTDIDGNIKETLRTDSGDAEPFSGVELWKRMDTAQYEPARYNAKAVIVYGGENPAYAETSFLIGKLFVKFLNFQTNATAGRINPVTVDVESWWGNLIENVRAEISVFDANNTFKGDFRTESVDLSPWQKATLKGYWDANGLEAGNYTASVSLKYKGGETIETLKVMLQKQPEEKTSKTFGKVKEMIINPIFLAALAIILVINVIIWIIKRKKKAAK